MIYLGLVNEQNKQLRILYPAKLSFRIKGEIIVFLRETETERICDNKPALQEISVGTL